MKINDINFGFCLLRKEEIADIGVTLYEFKHNKSGATLVYLENDDTNKCFAAGFKTLPEDSTGICHILEHSVLCGSDKYPLKEPFVNLLKGSMATFLNAMTARDFTIYPIASQNDKDFKNLMSTYMDAVFAPLSIKDKKPFLQEGWHLELLNKEDNPSYKGVVYNEMIGAMSSPDEQLMHAIYKVMYKGTGYEYNSGGDPKVIPSLTYEYYKKFYEEHYHPENCLLYLYGKMDILERLEYMDKEYLSKYEVGGFTKSIDLPSKVVNEDVNEVYAISPEEDEKDNTYMALSYSLGPVKENGRDIAAFNILTSVLMSTNESPLKKLIMESEIGQDVSAFVDDSSVNPCFTVELEKTNPELKEKFKEVFISSCEKIVKEGIDQELLLATINYNEFKLKESDMGRMPKGLFYSFSLMQSFNYDLDYVSELSYSDRFKFFKDNISTGYFEGLITKYILNSDYHVQVTMTPSKTLDAENEEKMNKLMSEIKASLSEDDIDALIKQTNELIAYQSKKDTPEELATLPTLGIEDIDENVNVVPTEVIKKDNYEVLEHVVNTNKISYLKIYLNIDSLSVEEIMYAKLVNSMLMEVDTTNYTVMDLQRYKKLYLGSLGFGVSANARDSKDGLVVKQTIIASSLNENASKIAHIVDEVIHNSIFKEDKVKMFLLQSKNGLRQTLIQDGMDAAMTQVNSSLTAIGSFYAKTGGLSMYRFIDKALEDLPNTIEKMNEVYKKMFNLNNSVVSFTGSREAVDYLYNVVDDCKFVNAPVEAKNSPSIEPKLHKALIIPSGVNYNAKGINLNDINRIPHGSLNVLAHIIRYDYLWPEVRVKGGAYGCTIAPSLITGSLTLGSFRDPNVKNTYNVFNNISEYLRNFECSEEEYMSYLIGAIGAFDRPSSINSMVASQDNNYLANISNDDRRRIKREMRDTKIEDIKNYADVFDYLKDNGSTYSVGNETTLKEYGEFDEYTNL